MRAIAACVLLVASVLVASADDKVLVLKAEGRADKVVRTKVEGAVVKLAAKTGATLGDVTFGDAAVMVGCKPDEDKCKDEVLGMLAVEEIIAITTTPKPGGIEVSVRRISKGGVTKSAAVIVTAARADQLEAIEPLFAPPAPPPPAVVTPTPLNAVNDPYLTPPTETTPPPSEPLPPPVTSASTVVTPPIEERRDEERPRGGRRLAMFGMAGGAAMVIVGVVFWASASNVEDTIAGAPKKTRADLEHVKDLEAEGDAYATTGNVLTVGGIILGGVSTYFFLKSGKRAQRIGITPTTGNGAALTWGGSL